ncbi:uncharacterized protein BJ171DRAFT_515227 [Polychytrium aggregatum]|uniref:uncharacterized protein n=1 Tax=Polychytrium aggregatum TaxID=110093 RepID=UPI0022FEA51D|nr:uncharacterized protein BJ171DRAFT_515227 [Polychytrium aggregatum]KAI9202223.1 hypothetical protein BJ171DRAFT_515227 [Polychytrium aggregatum]
MTAGSSSKPLHRFFDDGESIAPRPIVHPNICPSPPTFTIRDALRAERIHRIARLEQEQADEQQRFRDTIQAIRCESDQLAKVRKDRVFDGEITESEKDIIKKRVELQQRQFHEYEKREWVRTCHRVRQLYFYMTEEEIRTANDEAEGDEETMMLNLTAPDTLTRIRKKIALSYGPAVETAARAQDLPDFNEESGGDRETEKKRVRPTPAPDVIKGRIKLSKVCLDEAIAQLESGVDPKVVYEGWSDARIRAYKMIKIKPNSYYYRFNAPGEKQNNGVWETEERELFMRRLGEMGADGQWGIFSMAIPGRVGYQCANYYRHLIKTGEIVDDNYFVDDNGDLRYLFGKKEGKEGVIRTHTKHGTAGNRQRSASIEPSVGPPSPATSTFSAMSSNCASVASSSSAVAAVDTAAIALPLAAEAQSHGSHKDAKRSKRRTETTDPAKKSSRKGKSTEVGVADDSSMPPDTAAGSPSLPSSSIALEPRKEPRKRKAKDPTLSNSAQTAVPDIPPSSAPSSAGDARRLVKGKGKGKGPADTTAPLDTTSASPKSSASSVQSTKSAKRKAAPSDSESEDWLPAVASRAKGPKTKRPRAKRARRKGRGRSDDLGDSDDEFVGGNDNGVNDDDDDNNGGDDYDDDDDSDGEFVLDHQSTTNDSDFEAGFDDGLEGSGAGAYESRFENPLPGFIDPITLDEVVRPAISPYGHVMGYDTWLRCLMSETARNICPITKKPLHKRELAILTFENIDEYRSKILNFIQ